MKIVKLENGSILIKDNSGNTTKKLDSSAYMQWMSVNNVAILHSGGDLILNAAEVISTQIEPAAEVPFTGNAYNLIDLLSQSFFNNITSAENFNLTPGNSLEITYYGGVTLGNPSGSTANIENIIYKSGATTIATKTLEYDANNNIIKINVN
jgi:hypothetical protein